MKNISKIINILLVSLSCLVAGIFIFGILKPTENKIDQSSLDSPKKSLVSQLENQDEMTNKYMKELQIKLRKAQLESDNELKNAQNYQKTAPKDEDWTKVPIEQQISKDGEWVESPGGMTRSTAGVRSSGINLNKDNAAEFIETARRNGYHVILSDTYEVISVTPIMNTKGINDSFETHPAQ